MGNCKVLQSNEVVASLPFFNHQACLSMVTAGIHGCWSMEALGAQWHLLIVVRGPHCGSSTMVLGSFLMVQSIACCCSHSLLFTLVVVRVRYRLHLLSFMFVVVRICCRSCSLSSVVSFSTEW